MLLALNTVCIRSVGPSDGAARDGWDWRSVPASRSDRLQHGTFGLLDPFVQARAGALTKSTSTQAGPPREQLIMMWGDVVT